MKQIPKKVGGVVHEGVEDGSIAGMWLLSYLMFDEGRCIAVPVAIYSTEKAALRTAFKIDQATKPRSWKLDTVFLGEDLTVKKLLNLLGDEGWNGLGCKP